MDNTIYIQLKTKIASNESYLTNGRLRNICRRTRKNRDMLRVGTIITITLVLVYSTLASSYAFAAGPDPHDICPKSGPCACDNNIDST